jgi:putative transcriptional regulator
MRTRIKEYRAKKNYTQEKLAEIVGVRRETILFLEQGKYNPSLKLAYKIARALEASIDDIFILDDDLFRENDSAQGEAATS